MYRYADRNQIALMPAAIEDYVAKDHPVRAYDAFIEALDLKELGIELDPDKVGNSSYHPKIMLKLLIYGYSYGVRSSRKLERETVNNISFIWLMGGLAPDHKTIAEFRRNNKEPIKKALKQCARLCMDLGLIDGNVLFVDGTKIDANAGIKNNWTKKRCQKALEHIDSRIEKLLSDIEIIDESEKETGSYVHMNKQIDDAEAFKNKVKDILKELNEEDKRQLNTVDPDCRAMNSIKGSRPAYNNQLVVDQKNGLIVSAETTNSVTDVGKFASSVEQAQDTLGKSCVTACADSGYADTDDLAKTANCGVNVIVASKQERESKKSLTYMTEHDCFICQQGKRLLPSGLTHDKKSKIYRIEHPSDCAGCKASCSEAKNGRATSRLLKEDLRQRFIAQYRSPEGKHIYGLRRQTIELVFGHIKRNLKFDSFLLRGLAGAGAEFALACCCFNITRMMTLLGTQQLIAKLTA